MWRYGRLVQGVCRRTAGDRHAAEDAAQATFLLLARKADTLRDPATLPGWLARVAYRCAVKARASGGRQPPGAPGVSGQPFHPAGTGGLTPPARPDPDPAALELFAALDAELDRLPDRLRLPVVLIHLDGRTYAEAAARLGIPVGTLSGRLLRGRAILKDRLTRRGLAPLVVPVAVVADPGRVAAVTRAALAFAAGDPTPTPAAALALGVLRAMTLPKLLVLSAAAVVAVGLVTAGLAADPPPTPAPVAAPAVTDRDRLQGEWLFESATDGEGRDVLSDYWSARLVFLGDTAAVVGGPHPAAAATAVTLDPTATPKRIDWLTPGVYELGDDGLLWASLARPPGAGPAAPVTDRVTLAGGPVGPPLPKNPRTDADGRLRFTARRWSGPPGGKPTEGTVTVLLPDGTPAAGATVGQQVRWSDDTVVVPPEVVADAAGVARVPAGDRPHVLTAAVAGRKLYGFVPTSLAGLHHGLTVRLATGARVTGRLAVSPPTANGAVGTTVVSLARPGGRTLPYLASFADPTGRFEFVAPAGDYELIAGGDAVRVQTTPLRVPPGVEAVDAGTITAARSDWGEVVGRPAPGLPGVARWVGPPTTLEALKGQAVLVYFLNLGSQDPATWRREVVAATHDRYAARGLAVVGVYADGTGQTFDLAAGVLAADKPPFPVALAGGLHPHWNSNQPERVRVPLAAAYAAYLMPHGVLIDRNGVVRDRWYPGDKGSDRRLEGLLAE